MITDIVISIIKVLAVATAVIYIYKDIYNPKFKIEKKYIFILIGALLLFIILIIGLFFPSLVSLFWIWLIRLLVNDSFSKLSKDLPTDYINYYLVEALSGILGLGTYFTIRFLLISTDEKKRNRGIFSIGLGFVTYPLLCYFIIMGSGYKKCASNLQGGYEYVDPGLKIDPKYRTKVCDCTQEMILSIEGKTSPTAVGIQISLNTRFFTYDGQPLVWYYEHKDGKLEFFDHAGVHPQYGIMLKPVTEEIVEKALNYINTNKKFMLVSNKENNTDSTMSSSSPSLLNTTLVSTKHSNFSKTQITNDFSSYINSTAANKNGISITVIDENGLISNPVSNAIAKIYSQSGKTGNIGLIRADFFKTKGFQQLFDGNSGIIEKLKLDQFTSYLGIGKIIYSFRNGTSVDGTVICDASIAMNIISANSKSLVQSFTIVHAGNGVTESQAKEDAFQKLLSIYSTDHSSL